MNDQMNNDLVNGTRRTSFFLGLMCGIAGMSTLALVGFFVLAFSGQGVRLGQANENSNVNAAVNVNQPVANEPTETSVTPVPAVTSDDHVQGSANAKVTLIEYSDFECPYCARHKDTTDQIIQNYGDKVRIVFRHYPLSFHPNAQKAAEASECAAEQGKFWEMYDKIFAANNAGTMSVDKWKAEAKSLGLNTKKFNECLDSGKYAAEISAEEQAGVAAGVEGTPATFVNGELVSGALPYDQFKSIIDSKL
ncbi:thioredoxin domain-containing protein [Candidatus Falkowbacteria bacterium]|nr:thioredoxin domain-containing protein [Candidatus Falkowbacteria bacterium]